MLRRQRGAFVSDPDMRWAINKLIDRELLGRMDLRCERFEFCPEVTAKVRKRGFRIHEVPIRYQARPISAGKKIRWWDGVEALWTLLKYRCVD